ncbi:MAG: hypothetical protein K8F91_03940, partial [Candidatus Obscuribacterales bacterium]|nr:hypothetical protein [Candidatus Obscuribacterales bacterium]
MAEGADQCLPFILFWLYLYCIPFALVWMLVHWVKQFFSESEPGHSLDDEVLRFNQNKKSDLHRYENNFYYSRVFGPVIVAVFALGIPAFLSFSLYQNLGIERQMTDRQMAPPAFTSDFTPLATVSHESLVSRPFLGQARGPLGGDATIVMSYNGSWTRLKRGIVEQTSPHTFWIYFYMCSLGAALSAVFIRAWFLFPMNFLTDEHVIDISASGIRRRGARDWFFNAITFNKFAIGGGPDSLKWSQIKRLGKMEEGFTRLYPLPETAFSRESLTYKLLNKGAAFIDGLSNKVNTGNELVLSASPKGADGGRNIKLDLNSMNVEERARLFYFVKRWAPHVIVDKGVEKLLLGSSVLSDVRYTQLWFDLLTNKSPRDR